MVRFEHINKTFKVGANTFYALKDVSLHIEKGDIYGIIGFSGAGKSTLVRCINLLERPDSGKVYIGGTEITSLNNKELRNKRRKIGMIFQHFNLFQSRTVYQNIEYPLKYRGIPKEEIKKKTKKLLELVELEDKSSAYPSQLSGGQKQRVAIARALADDPDILLSDESTSALDPQTTSSILKLLKRVNKELGITIVVITHQMQVVKEICNKVAVMEEGKVVEEGDVFDIFANPKQAITKSFTDSTSGLSNVYECIKEKGSVLGVKKGDCVIKLKYVERRTTAEPVVSQVAKKFDVDISILFGNIELVEDNPIGGLVTVVSGKADDIDNAIDYIRKKGIEVEVVLDARAS